MVDSIILGMSAIRLGRWPHRPAAYAIVEYLAMPGGLSRSGRLPAMAIARINFVGARHEILRAVAQGEPRRSVSPDGVKLAGPAVMIRAAGAAIESAEDCDAVFGRGCTLTIEMSLHEMPAVPLVETGRVLGRLRPTALRQCSWTLSHDYQVFDQQMEFLAGLRDPALRPLWTPTGEAHRKMFEPLKGMRMPDMGPTPPASPGEPTALSA